MEGIKPMQQMEDSLAKISKTELIQKMEDSLTDIFDDNSKAILGIEKRIKKTGEIGVPIIYSDLVRNIEFSSPNLNDGEPFFISNTDWSGLNRALIGQLLAKISIKSYKEHGFMASALVVNSSEYKPSAHFFEWMNYLGIIPNLNDSTILIFWVEQVRKAVNHYKKEK